MGLQRGCPILPGSRNSERWSAPFRAYFQPLEGGGGLLSLSQVASNTPSHHTTSALHLTHPQASRQGQHTRNPLSTAQTPVPKASHTPAIHTSILHLLSTLPDV